MGDKEINTRPKGMPLIVTLSYIAYVAMFGKDPSKIDVNPFSVWNLRFKKPQPVSQTLPGILQSKQFTLFGDTNHTDIRIPEFFYGRENIRYMRDANVRYVFIEMEPKYQPLIDALVHQQIGKDEFTSQLIQVNRQEAISEARLNRSRMNSGILAQGVLDMKQQGIAVHCIDDRSNITAQEFLAVDFVYNSVSRFLEDPRQPFHGRITAQLVLSMLGAMSKEEFKTAEENLQAKFALTAKTLIGKRQGAAGNTDMADRIQRITGNDKGVVLIGAGHLYGRDDLDNLLGKDRATTVMLYGDRKMYCDLWPSFGSPEEKPDYMSFIDERSMFGVTSKLPFGTPGFK